MYLDNFVVSCPVLEISAVEISAFSLNVVLTAPKIHLKNSTLVSLPRNHDPVTQDIPQTLL